MSTPKRSPSQRFLLRTPVTASRSASSWLSRPSVVLPLVGLLVFLLTLLPFTSRLLPHLKPGTDPSGGGGGGGQQPLPGPPMKPGGAERVRIGTWNLRFDGLRDRTVPVGQPGDGSEREKVVVEGDGLGERPWAERRWRVLDTILQFEYDIIGFQEAFKSQVDDLQTLLGEGWSWVGVGRDDGYQAGEYSPIFYNSDLYESISHEYLWLSPTPSVPGSKGWDASQPRIATIVSLSSKTTGEILHVANTHWDDQGVRAREEAGKMLRTILPDVARKVEKKKDIGDGETLVGAVLLIGDLNSPAEEKGYQSLVNATSITPSLKTPPFYDAIDLLALRPPSYSPPLSRAQQRLPHLPFGPRMTYTGFLADTDMTRIDFVFLYEESKAGLIKGGYVVSKYAVIDNWVDGDETGWKGRVSDHRAVMAEIVKV